MTQEAKVCNYTFSVDGAGNPVIEAETQECKDALKQLLEERETILRVKVAQESPPSPA